MFGSKPKNELVGAAQKRAEAMKYRQGFSVQSKKEGKSSQTVPVLFVLLFAMGLSFAISDLKLMSGVSFRTGFNLLDDIMFGATPPMITGDQGSDNVIAIFIRTVLIAAAAGVLPVLTYLWQRMRNTMQANPYVTFWGVTAFVAFAVVAIPNYVVPYAADLLKTMTGK